RPRGAEASTISSTIYANRSAQVGSHLVAQIARYKVRAEDRLRLKCGSVELLCEAGGDVEHVLAREGRSEVARMPHELMQARFPGRVLGLRVVVGEQIDVYFKSDQAETE
ncbi:MAG: hypothetical protein WB646_13685, partial [Steroidobacteraceae bacterium]